MTTLEQTQDIATPRILVVDDEPRVRSACEMVLTEEGYNIALAPDGEQGLLMIAAEHFDIVLLDLMMPNISGFDVLSKIRAIHPDTVVIVITGYATIEHSIEAMKKGAFDFIPKPFTPDQLRVVVSKAIRYNRALQDIAGEQSRLRVMVNRLSDGVMATDTQKRVVLANPAFLSMIGYHGKEILGQKVEEFIACDRLLQLIDHTLTLPEEDMTESTREIRLGENDERILDARCAMFKGRAGTRLGTITVLHDITALKQLDQMKSDFVSLVSHEIRSPMNSLLAQIKVVLDGLAGEVTEKQKEILGRAYGKIENLIAMASELLDLSRIESGLIAHEKVNVEVVSFLADVLSFQQESAREKNIEICIESPPDLPSVLANRQNLEEVFSNLITNAIKYSPPGSRVVVSAGTEAGQLVIKVSDTGFGIPPEDIDKIFDRFYRVKDEKTRYIHGTGLGLAIVKNIVEAHNGSVRVESRPGHGSTFSVFLPQAE